jgi:type I restriction enzyme S subunit
LLKLGDVSQAPQYGWTTRASSSGSIHLLRTTDITSGKIDWDQVPYCEKLPDNIEKYLLHDGDIVISRAGSVGYSYLIKNPNKAIFASYLIRFKPKINEKYFFYFLKSPSYWRAISEKKLGIAVPNVNATKLKSINIPIPPETEQEKIVLKIEELFSQLDAGVTGLKRVQSELQRYRASVLKAAFEGRLVPQDPNDEPAEKILMRLGAEPIVREDLLPLPENWIWTSLGSITHPERNRVQPRDYPNFKYIGMADVESMTMKLLSTRSASEMKSTAETFTSGDVLYGSLRPYLNKVIRPHFDGLCSTEFIVFPQTPHLNNDYLRIFLNTSEFVAYSNSLNTGDRPRVKFEQLKNYPFPLPPINEQERIVNTLEKHISIIQSLDEMISENINRAQTMKQAILNRAFEGKLLNNIQDYPMNIKRINEKL